MKWLGWVAAAFLLPLAVTQWQPTGRQETPDPEEKSPSRPTDRLAALEDENRDLRRELEELRRAAGVRASVPATAPPAAPERENPKEQARAYGKVQGRILCRGSVPLWGIPVRLRGDSSDFEAFTKSGPDGFYQISAPPGPYQIGVEEPERTARQGERHEVPFPPPEPISLFAGQTRVRDFLLPTGAMELWVLDADTGAPILFLEDRPVLQAEGIESHAAAFSKGRLQYLDLPDGVYVPSIESEVYRVLPDQRIAVQEGRANQAILLQEGGRVEFCFVSKDGSPYIGSLGLEKSEKGKEAPEFLAEAAPPPEETPTEAQPHEEPSEKPHGSPLIRLEAIFRTAFSRFGGEHGERIVLETRGSPIQIRLESKEWFTPSSDGSASWHLEEGLHVFRFFLPHGPKPFSEQEVRAPRTGRVSFRIVLP